MRCPGTIWCPLVSRSLAAKVARMTTDHLTIQERRSYRSLEDVVGCKWSAAVLGALQRGVSRPGRLERYIPGISTKILTERLRKLLAYDLVARAEIPGRVPHVEYRLTPEGVRLAEIIEQLHRLQGRHDRKRQKKENA